jgi:hypothetical protein
VARASVSFLTDAVRSAWAAIQRSAHSVRWPDWVIPCLYLLGAIAVTWRIWANPDGTVPSNGGPKVSPDVYLNVWFMRYTATAVAHGHLPALITTAVNAPQGINAMWNTSMLLPGVLLTPVTLLAGPIVSLAVLLTLGFAGSAASLYLVLRRWRAQPAAAGIGGALYGFSPALLVAAEDHYHLQFAVLPPLIIDALLRLATGRGRPIRTGIWLGLLVAAQVFIAEELLVDTALAGAIFLAVLVACRPSKVLHRVGGTSAGIGVGVVVALVLCGHALWVQFHGPLAETGSPWRLWRYGNIPANFVTAPNAVLFHGQFRQFLMSTNQFLVECFAYLGWPLLGLLAATAIFCWRDLRVRISILSFALLELLSAGGRTVTVGTLRIPNTVLPWHWMRHLPVVSQALPQRISILADGAAAAALAFGLERAMSAATAGAPAWRRPAVAAVAGLALLPVIPRAVPGAVASPSPPGFRAAVAGLRLRPEAPVLVLPARRALAMDWQAMADEPISLVGGYCIAPDPSGKAVPCDTHKALSPDQRITLIRTSARPKRGHFGPSPTEMAGAIAAWRPAAVVTDSGGRSSLGRYLTRFFGPPTVRHGMVLGWRLRDGCGSQPQLEPAAGARAAASKARLCANARRQRAGGAGTTRHQPVEAGQRIPWQTHRATDRRPVP